MSAIWAAVWIGILAPASLYLSKRVVDYVLPPDHHWPCLDRFSRPNHEEEDTHEHY